MKFTSYTTINERFRPFYGFCLTHFWHPFFGVRKFIFKGMSNTPQYQTSEQDDKFAEQRQLMKQRQRDQRDAMRRQQQKIRDLQR